MLEQGKPKEALPVFEQVLESDAENHAAMYAVGAARRDLKEFPEAEKALKRVLAFYPDDAKARAFLGEVQLTQGKFEDARSNFIKVIDKEPDSVAALTGLGKAEYFLGNRFAGEQFLKKALSLEPDNKFLIDTVRITQEANRQFLREEAAEKRRRVLQAFNEQVAEAGRQWSESLAQRYPSQGGSVVQNSSSQPEGTGGLVWDRVAPVYSSRWYYPWSPWLRPQGVRSSKPIVPVSTPGDPLVGGRRPGR